MVTRRPSIAPLIAGIFYVAATVLCTTIRVPNRYLDNAGQQFLIAGLLLAATTCFLLALRVRSRKTYPLVWLLVMFALVCCVFLT